MAKEGSRHAEGLVPPVTGWAIRTEARDVAENIAEELAGTKPNDWFDRLGGLPGEVTATRSIC